LENEDAKIPEGFILLARKIGAEDSWVRCLQPQHFKFMVMLLLRARWKAGVYMTPSGNILTVERGQYAAPVRRLAEECGVSYQSSRTGLILLARRGFLTHEVTQGLTVVTISNYERYQDIQNYINAIPNASLTQAQRKPNADTIKKESKEVKRKGITPGDANKYFYDNLENYAHDMASVIQDFEATRKGGKIQPSLIIKIVDSWKPFGGNLLLEAKKEWDKGQYAKEGQRENYFLGICRRLKGQTEFRRRKGMP
jgi:hypothetical protein